MCSSLKNKLFLFIIVALAELIQNIIICMRFARRNVIYICIFLLFFKHEIFQKQYSMQYFLPLMTNISGEVFVSPMTLFDFEKW